MMETYLELIPVFLAVFVTVILVFSVVIWRRNREKHADTAELIADHSVWLLLGLLLIAVFGLGAFVMYALLR